MTPFLLEGLLDGVVEVGEGTLGRLHVEGARVGVLLQGLDQEGSASVQADERRH
jgi:hypothetical protein